MKKIYMIFLFTLLCFTLVGCINNEKPDYHIQFFLLDETFGDLRPRVWIIAPQEKIDEYYDLERQLSAITNELDALYSASNTNSLLSEINKNSGIKPVSVTEELIEILKVAKEISLLSEVDGVALYDVSILPIVELWDINNLRYNKYSQYAEIPEDDAIKELLPLVNYKNIIIDEENLTVFLKKKGMRIDLGSILKGYAADRIKIYLNSIGIEKGLIDVAGNLYVMGQNLVKGKFIDWEVLIQTPYEFYGDTLTCGSVIKNDITAVTSGSYERFILTKDLKEYHHILDPRTGYPNNSDILSITIITTNSMRADALSTAIFSVGLERGYEIIENMDDAEAIFLTTNKKVYITSGLDGNFKYNESVNKIGYEYKGVKNGTSN